MHDRSVKARRGIHSQEHKSPTSKQQLACKPNAKLPFSDVSSSTSKEIQTDGSSSLEQTSGSRPENVTNSLSEGEADASSPEVHTKKSGKSPTRQTNVRNENNVRPQKCTPDNNTLYTGKMDYIYAFLVAFLVFLASFLFYNYKGTNAKETKLCSFDLLKSEYPLEQDDLWKSLRVGTETILNNDNAVPGVYLFLHSNNTLSRKLIWDIAGTAAICFSPALKPIELSNKDFTSEETKGDYGIVIDKYKQKIKEGGALIVANLNEIPGEAARALHAICDTYSPIVRKVVIFMTLKTPQDQVGKDIQIAEDTLFNLWALSIKRSELDPLITRITDQVFRIHAT